VRASLINKGGSLGCRCVAILLDVYYPGCIVIILRNCSLLELCMALPDYRGNNTDE
jgi:hypothetical protein